MIIDSLLCRMLPLYDIYLYISRNYPFYGMEAKGSKAWQNAIRHNLTLNPNFEKVARPSPRLELFLVEIPNFGVHNQT